MAEFGITGAGPLAGQETPHLLGHLWTAYQAYLTTEMEKLKANGSKVRTLQEIFRTAPSQNFVSWATQYLENNRVTETFAVDGNFGVRLNDATVVLIGPGADAKAGSMEPAQAVPITTGRG